MCFFIEFALLIWGTIVAPGNINRWTSDDPSDKGSGKFCDCKMFRLALAVVFLNWALIPFLFCLFCWAGVCGLCRAIRAARGKIYLQEAGAL